MKPDEVHTITADGELLAFSARLPIPDDEIVEILRKYDHVVIQWVSREEFQKMLEER